jgi:hypothetical protein
MEEKKRVKVQPGPLIFNVIGYDSRLFMLTLLMMPGIASCGICKPVKLQVEYRDSVRVEIRERVVHDTATFEVPGEVERIVTRDTSSRLENSYAVSEAVVTGGLLHHSLRTKPQTIEVPVAVRVRDTTTAHTSSAVEEQKIIEGPRELTWWQEFRLKAFWVLVASLAIIVFVVFKF